MPLRNIPSNRLAWLAAALAALPLETLARPEVELCGGEPMPTGHAPYTVRCAEDFGIVGTGGDVTPQFSAALETLKHEKVRLFLPAGAYGIRIRLDLPANVGLVGSHSGRTRLTNYTDASQLGAVTGTLGLAGSADASDIAFVQNLHFENVRLLVSPWAHATILQNVFQGFRSDMPQLHLEGHGRRIVEDNVFWGESFADMAIPDMLSARDGVAIRLSGDEPAPGADDSTTIRNNLIGAIDPGRLDAGHARSARRLATTAIGTRMPAHLGHYGTAIQVFGVDNVRFEGNVIASGTPRQMPKRHKSRHVPLAVFMGSKDLSLIGNTWSGGPKRSVELHAVSGADLRRNTFAMARLRIDTFRDRPTKRVVVQDNWFLGNGIAVRAAVNGTGEDHTSPDDVLIAGNVVTGLSRSASGTTCGYTLRPPLAGTRNFAVEAAQRLSLRTAHVETGPGSTERTISIESAPARVCVR